MDNDLMARRLRPPSEPAQTAPLPGPFTLPEYAEQATPSFPAWAPTPAPVEEAYQPPAADLAEAWAPAADDYATAEQVDVGDEDAPPESPFGLDAMPAQMDALAQFEMPSGFETPAELEIPARFEIPPPSEGVRYEAAASTQSPLTDDAPLEAHPTHETPPWSPQARDEVPWDRPGDFEQPTDTATPDQPSWDRPAPELWVDSNYVGDPAGDVFGAVADANDVLPYWPDAANGQAAAVASTPRVDEAPAMAATASDPDDAYAPVLGDIATPANRAWPEMNDHNAGHKNGTVGVEAIAQTADPAQAPADARGDWVDTIESFPGWSGPQPSHTDQPSEPVPTEWVMAAAEPAELAQPTPDSLPEQVPAVYADANPQPEAADAAPTTAPDAAPHAEPASFVAPDQMVMAPSQPLILRIELAIVDDSRLVVGSADAAWRVNDVNAIVLEVSQQSDVASEAEAPTPRHPAFEPRSSNGAEGADPTDATAAAAAPAPAENTWLEPDFPGPSSDDAFPAASLDPPPWLDPTALAGPEPAHWDHAADPAPSVSPDSTWLAPVPPASAQPPPWTQLPLPEQSTHWPPGDFAPSGRQADVDPLSGMLTTAQASGAAAPQFAPAGHFSRVDATASRRDVAQSAFAPRVYVESELAQPAPSESAMSVQAPAVAQEQSDLWFLATENADGDAATSDEIKVAKEPSPMLTAGLTIAFAILVIVLILVFIQLMTSLLR